MSLLTGLLSCLLSLERKNAGLGEGRAPNREQGRPELQELPEEGGAVAEEDAEPRVPGWVFLLRFWKTNRSLLFLIDTHFPK